MKVCIAIEKHLIHKYKLVPRREWYLVLDHEDRIIGMPRYEITQVEKLRSERYRCPDLIWYDNGLWILEVDGFVHHLKSSKTEKRNEIYRNNNCNFLIINTYEMGKTRVINREIESILLELDKKMMKKWP